MRMLLRYDAAGNEVWTRQFGTDGNHFDGVRCVATDSAWVYVAGQTNGAFPGQVSAGGFDAWVRKFDTDSNAVWTTQFGTSRLDVPFGVAVHATGVYVTGQTSGHLCRSDERGWR
jgi:hypothetical protein